MEFYWENLGFKGSLPGNLPGNVMTTTIENQVFTDTIVNMDDKKFMRCEFSRCTLRYTGGECDWDEHTIFNPSCTWKFEYAALRTVEILRSIGWLSSSGSLFPKIGES